MWDFLARHKTKLLILAGIGGSIAAYYIYQQYNQDPPLQIKIPPKPTTEEQMKEIKKDNNLLTMEENKSDSDLPYDGVERKTIQLINTLNELQDVENESESEDENEGEGENVPAPVIPPKEENIGGGEK